MMRHDVLLPHPVAFQRVLEATAVNDTALDIYGEILISHHTAL